MPRWVFYSSKTGTTAKLIERANLDALRLPIGVEAPTPIVPEPFILVTPTFGDNEGRGNVPKAVIRFLNIVDNRNLIRAVIATGDRNFFDSFASAGDVIAHKCKVPLLCRIERDGTASDWKKLQAIDLHFSTNLSLKGFQQ